MSTKDGSPAHSPAREPAQSSAFVLETGIISLLLYENAGQNSGMLSLDRQSVPAVHCVAMTTDPLATHKAHRDFDLARRRAWRERLSARLGGRDEHLLPFAAIRAQLKQKNPLYQGILSVPLSQIAGSVGRYQEFTRQFLPLHDSFRDRWVRVESLALSGQGWPPPELYRIGEVYFVKDGNHRIAIARQMKLDVIDAQVWAFPSEVELGPNDRLDDVLIRFGERHFLEQTRLDQLVPDHQIKFTTPGRYTELLAQIEELREKLQLIDEEPVTADDAVLGWYELVYLPTVQILHDARLLQEFAGRTEADLFVWLSLMRQQLAELYGGYDRLEDLARALAADYGAGRLGKLSRQVRRLLGQDSPAPLELPDEPSS